MKKIRIFFSTVVTVLILILTNSCQQELVNPVEILNQEETNEISNEVIITSTINSNLFTVKRIKGMIHEAVEEHPDFTYNEDDNTYIYTDWDYDEIFSATNITDLIYVIGGLGLQEKIDISNLGPRAQSYYNEFLGIDKGIYYEPHSINKKKLRWYYDFSSDRGHYYVPYYMTSDIDNIEETNIRNGMKVIEKLTRVRFVKDTENYRTQTPVNGIHVRFIFGSDKDRLKIEEVAGGGFAGRARYARLRGEGFLQINPNSGYTQRTIIHELLHAITIAHEHQRSDRGQYFSSIANSDQTSILNTGYRDSKGCFRRQYYYHLDFDAASIMNYGTIQGGSFGTVRYSRDDFDVHVKQARFQFNLTDGIPLAHRATASNSLTEFSTANSPVNNFINRTLNGTATGRLINRMDSDQLCYGSNFIISSSGGYIYITSYFSHGGMPPPIGLSGDFFGDGHVWTVIYTSTEPTYIGTVRLYETMWRRPGNISNLTHPIHIPNVSHIPAIVFENNNLNTDDEKVAFMLASECDGATISNHQPGVLLDFLDIMRAEITNINPHVPWEVNDHLNPTTAELNAYNNSVHEINYRDIYNYILSRIQGSANFNTNYRLEYLWVAPVIGGSPVMQNHFLSAGDIATIQQVTH